MTEKLKRKTIYFLLLPLLAAAAAGYCFCLPRTLFDEPFSATVWSRDGRLMSAKVASDGQWRFFPTDSVPYKFRVAITTYEDKRFYRHFGVDPLVSVCKDIMCYILWDGMPLVGRFHPAGGVAVWFPIPGYFV